MAHVASSEDGQEGKKVLSGLGLPTFTDWTSG
jgi:hypothetical protein